MCTAVTLVQEVAPIGTRPSRSGAVKARREFATIPSGPGPSVAWPLTVRLAGTCAGPKSTDAVRSFVSTTVCEGFGDPALAAGLGTEGVDDDREERDGQFGAGRLGVGGGAEAVAQFLGEAGAEGGRHVPLVPCLPALGAAARGARAGAAPTARACLQAASPRVWDLAGQDGSDIPADSAGGCVPAGL